MVPIRRIRRFVTSFGTLAARRRTIKPLRSSKHNTAKVYSSIFRKYLKKKATSKLGFK